MKRIRRVRVLYLPFVVLAELWYGVELRRWGPARRAELEAFLQEYVVVESASDVSQAWVAIRVHCHRWGRPIERQDAWVAAVALGLPLVTHNAAHFAHVSALQIITEPDR